MDSLKLLLVDDDQAFVTRFEALSEGLFELRTVRSGCAGLEALRAERFDAALLDVDLRGEPDGLAVLREVHRELPDLPVIMISGDERPETVVSSMKQGAVDYVSKSPNLELLKLKVQQALDNVAWRDRAREPRAEVHDLIGTSEPMRRLREEIAVVGRRDIAVLIRGESGTGKELVAAALHRASARASRGLIPICAAAGPDELFEAELYGHERGAFTGAASRRVGKLELARGGTLFLDEVGKMPLQRQAKLLRMIESPTFERVGGREAIVRDCRLITASNEHLESKIERGEFLEDFYFRIRDYELYVPPLRDRLEDIPELATGLLARFAKAENVPVPELTEEALDVLAAYSWPGNVRQLDSALKRAAILADGEPLDACWIRRALKPVAERPVTAGRGSEREASRATKVAGSAEALSEPTDRKALCEFLGPDYWTAHRQLARAFDRLLFDDALERSAGNKSEAARSLKVSRAVVTRRLREFGLTGKTRADPEH